MSLEIYPLTEPAILAEINNAAVPDVNELTLARAGWLVENAAFARLARLDGRLAGVIVALDETSGYDSDYFRWFTAHYRNFLYVDRVIVAAWARGRGVAALFYRHLEELAEARDQAIASEVYSEPPNVPSLNFHRKMGYAEVGQQFSHSEGKTVAKLIKFPERARPIPPVG